MDLKSNRIHLEESLKDLKQKLVALDMLMHNTTIVGDPLRNRSSLLKNYSKSNPFATDNKSSNLILNKNI
ncbi:hypothetical protein [Marinifilum sp. D737]|uniref:hypothetical protein n=1 Tax=Marinifilum sp. D737 TaxID=2969628 RepID=UPI002273CDF0|nr:hypothetical protein [Marinifilum sp. D737]MCY1633954.1 hypothetical protein [Marinifilum sp. D737]